MKITKNNKEFIGLLWKTRTTQPNKRENDLFY